MKSALLLLGLVVAAGLAGPSQAQTQPPAPSVAAAPATASNLTPAQARLLLEVLQNPAARERFIGTLQALMQALPAAATSAAAPAAPATVAAAPTAAASAATPATAPAAKPAAAAKSPAAAPAAAKAAPAKVQLQPNGLGAQIARRTEQALAALPGHAATTVRNLLNFPMLWSWLHGIASDPVQRDRLAAMGWRLLAVLGSGLIAERVIGLALARPRRLVCEHQPPPSWEQGNHEPADPGADPGEAAAEAGETERRRRPSALAMLRRLPFALLAFVLDLVPLGAFLAAAYAVLAAVEPSANARLVILGFIDAWLTCRIVLAVARTLFAPGTPRMRLINISGVGAGYVVRWLVVIIGVAVFGRAIAATALLYGLYRPAEMALLKLVMLLDHLLLVAVVLYKRRAISRRLAARPGRAGPVAMFRNFLAATWHWVAVFVILALWLVWAFEVPNGFARLLHVFVVTAAILLAARLFAILVLGAVDRSLRVRPDVASRFPELQARTLYYYPILRRTISGVIWLFTLMELCEAWGMPVWHWVFSGGLGGRAAWALVIIALTLVLAVVAWEAVNLWVQSYLRRLIAGGQGARAARLRTLVPIIRAALFTAIGAFAGLTVLAEIGVNLGPLLAGAGIVGVAVGFGSQKLVQDFITGIFLLFENAMQVGDWVTLAGLSGTVENLSVRTIRLRGGDGSIYIVPFSSVTTVNNTNRGLGNAAVSVDLDFLQDTDRASQVLKDVAAEMRQDPAFQKLMLGELQLWGVDKVEGWGVTIAGQIPCTDAGRWPVQREFNRRMKKRFQEAGILIANQPVPPAPVVATSASGVAP